MNKLFELLAKFIISLKSPDGLLLKVWSFMKNNKKVVVTILALLLVYRVAGDFITGDSNNKNGAYQLVTTKLSVGEISEFVKTSGKIAPEQEQKIRATLARRVSILKVNVKYGDLVEPGQILLELDSAEITKDLEVITKKLELLEIDFNQAQQKSDDDEKLLEKGFIPKNEYDESVSELKKIAIEIELMKKEELKFKEELEKLKIVSPIKGRIDYINEQIINSGSVDVNNWLFTVSSSADRLKLSLSVDGRAITKIKEGQEVSFRIDTYPNKDLFGSVIKIVEPLNLNPHKDKAPVFYEIIASVAETDVELKAGMSVDASIKIQTKLRIKRIPRSALRFVPPKIIRIRNQPPQNTTTPIIWIVNRDGSISAVPITTGIRDNDFVEFIELASANEKDYKLSADDDIVTGVTIFQDQKKKSRFALPQPKRY
ncbi:MAG: efflux RND transporter periplasmic adaptor subunit [Thermodesulfobacteriota bacterium]|nr:efflux RND transporter periplasmic adaptor subunit [Thermodesulfobacteriota bacterium]|tara:strand:- start:73143 stop:74429 length:1287 start_codon:yes stop_codon:yes gene_type:complete